MHERARAWVEDYDRWLKAMPDAPDLDSITEQVVAECGQAMLTLGGAARALGAEVERTGIAVLSTTSPDARVRAMLALHLWSENREDVSEQT